MNRSERVKEIRSDLRISQGDFAKKIGVSQVSISQIENGGNPSLEIMEKISDNFEVSLLWLLKGTGEKFKKDEELVLVNAPTKDVSVYEKIMKQQEERIAFLEEQNNKLLAKSSVNDSNIEAEVDGENPLTFSLTHTPNMA